MEYSLLGRSGLKVSRLALGTAAFGLKQYGILIPGEEDLPRSECAISMLHRAVDAGINFFDTARGYGSSEALLGEAFGNRPDCLIATKVAFPPGWDTWNPGQVREHLDLQLHESLQALRRDTIDLLQIHNATMAMLGSDEIWSWVNTARRAGKIRSAGASVYGEHAALAAIQSGHVDVLQISFSILDQRMAGRVLAEAERSALGVLVRSALLKGALTVRARFLPGELQALREGAESACRLLRCSWEALPQFALRFCWSIPGVHSVLLGPRAIPELDAAIAAESEGRLESGCLENIRALQLNDERVLNPTFWPTA